ELTDDEYAERRRMFDIDGRAKGLNNLLNVVLIDPEGRWRGRWDRNPNPGQGEGTLLLGQEGASRGFLAGAIPAGQWQVAVECHGVYGPTVTYEIEVDARPTLSTEEVASLQVPTREYTNVKRK